MVHVHASYMIPNFSVVAPHRILSPLDGIPADAAWIFRGRVRGSGLGDISPDMRRRSVCSIWVLTEGLFREVNFEVQSRTIEIPITFTRNRYQ